MIKLAHLLTFFLFFLTHTISKTQNYHIGLTTRYGFIFPHRPSIAYIVKKHIPSFDITFSKQLTQKNWHKLYKYPYWGFGVYHANLGNPTYSGKAFASYTFFEIPIISQNFYTFHFKYAFGIAYLTKNYDYLHNYYNLVIGSPLNAFVDFGLINSLRIRHLRLAFGITYTHYSNGAITKPNLGFNIPSLSLTIGYVNNVKPFKKDTSIISFKKTYEFHCLIAGGIRQNSTSDPYRYFANTLAINLEKNISPKRKLGIGLDIFYDPSIPQRFSFSYEKPYIPYIRYGTHLSHDWLFGDFSVTFHVGRYLYDHYLLDGWIYSRVGIKYKLNSHVQANILLKSHFAKADIIEFGVSYYTTKHQIFKRQ
ncbi:MAG: acyloxyacyl hydrolase [Bacteroidales bacterium]|nr:acyloxyacyl hydrolase [Bacteroidales bacterium]